MPKYFYVENNVNSHNLYLFFVEFTKTLKRKSHFLEKIIELDETTINLSTIQTTVGSVMTV